MSFKLVNKNFHRYSNFDIDHMIKYSGALDDYPFLEQFFEKGRGDEIEALEDELSQLQDEIDSVEQNYINANNLLIEIFELLLNDNVEKISYKCLKENIMALKANSYWEY